MDEIKRYPGELHPCLHDCTHEVCNADRKRSPCSIPCDHSACNALRAHNVEIASPTYGGTYAGYCHTCGATAVSHNPSVIERMVRSKCK